MALLIAITFAGCKKDCNDSQSCEFVNYKYYYDKKDTFGILQNNYITMGIDSAVSEKGIRDFVAGIDDFDHSYNYKIYGASPRYRYKEVALRLSSAKSCEEITRLIHRLKENEIVGYAHFTYQTTNCNSYIGGKLGNLCVLGYGNDFYVSVKDSANLGPLYKTIEETNTELVEKDALHSTGLYKIRATKTSKGDALKMANYFQETGLFRFSDPSIGTYPVE